MSKLIERRDSLIKECETLQGQFKEASAARQKAETVCSELAAQFNDKQSRINELNSFIKEEEQEQQVEVEVEEPEACPA